MENLTTYVAIALYELEDPNNYHWALVVSADSNFHLPNVYQITNQDGHWTTYHREGVNLLASGTFIGIVRISTCPYSLTQMDQYIRPFPPTRPMGYGQGSNTWTCAHWVMNVLQSLSNPTRPALDNPISLDSWTLYCQVKASGTRLVNFDRFVESVTVANGLKQVNLARDWDTEW
jgi:hypothetical protein